MQSIDKHDSARSAHPPAKQVAALCWRKMRGRAEVLLITSRDTGRWIVPKGWPMKGLTDAQSALREAWEEAGVRADATKARRIGEFCYDKLLEDGTIVPVLAQVYKVRLREGDLTDRFPEAGQRKLVWVPARKAAKLVQEPALKAMLRNL